MDKTRVGWLVPEMDENFLKSFAAYFQYFSIQFRECLKIDGKGFLIKSVPCIMPVLF